MAALLLLLMAWSTAALEFAGFTQYVAECAACEIVGRVAQNAVEKDAGPKVLQREAAARLELIENLCNAVDHAYPKKSTLRGGRESLRFVQLDAGKVDDPDEDKVKALETAKHAGDLPEKIVRGKEKNVELHLFCERLLEEHDDSLAELIRKGDAKSLRTDFCVHTTKRCTKQLIDGMDESEKPFEPEMPVGMRPEDWPAFKKRMYDEHGNLRKQPLKKARKKRKRARK